MSSSCTDENFDESNLSEFEDFQEEQKEESVVLPHDDALQRVIEKKGAQNILPDWTTDDLKGLMVQIMRNRCDEQGIQNFAKYFRNTSVDEIKECLRTFKDINDIVSKERFRLDKFVVQSVINLLSSCASPSQQPNDLSVQQPDNAESSKVSAAHNSAELINYVRKSRRLADETPVVLSLILEKYCETAAREPNANKYVPISTSPCVKSDGMIGVPHYDDIYQQLSLLVCSRSLHKPCSLDSAILLDIFDDLEHDIEQLPKLHDFFKQMHCDIKSFPSNEFKVDTIISEENIGEISTNVLSLPSELLDFSKFIQQHK